MAYPIVKGTTYATGNQVTAANLNNHVDQATFDSDVVDNVTLQVASDQLSVKDGGITMSKLETASNGQLPIGNGAGFTKATLTAGGGTAVVNASGSITLHTATVASIAALKALSVSTFATNYYVNVLGYSSADDGGGGMFYYNSASSATADGGTIFAPDVGSGRWFRADTTHPNIMWFGADRSNTSTCTAALNLALAYMLTRNSGNPGGGVLFFPCGNYKFSTKPNSINLGVTLVGEGKAKTTLYRDYTEATATNGFIDMTVSGGNANAGGGVRNMTIYAATGTTGGCAISANSTLAVGGGVMTFDNVVISGDGTWAYGIYFDGSLKTGAPVGLRGVVINNSQVFQTTTEGIYAKSVLHLSINGTGIFSTGGGSNQGLTVLGVSGVSSESVVAELAFCSGLRIGPYASSVTVIASTVVADLVTEANVSAFTFIGEYTTHTNSSTLTELTFLSGGTSGVTRVPGRLAIGGATGATYGVEVKDNGISASKTGSTTQIGHIGVPSTTACNDTLTFTFTTAGGKLFSILTGGGAGVLAYADYKSATITLLSNPSSEFENSSTPTAGKTGIFKSANSHVISVKNGTGSLVNYSILFVGYCSAVTDPS